MNSFINAKTNVKKLQFGVDKCHQIHVGGQEHLTPELYVDNWEVKKISEEGKGVKNLKDVCEGDIMVERADADHTWKKMKSFRGQRFRVSQISANRELNISTFCVICD